MKELRRLWRLGRAALHIALGVAKAEFLYHRWPQERRRAEVRAWALKVFDIFGVRLEIDGKVDAIAASPRLLVANHVSWLDIYAILAVADVRFVAKTEVESWPCVGRLARTIGTVFVDRNGRSRANESRDAIARLLGEGTTVCLFPEATTTDGSCIRPFHPPMLQAAVDRQAQVQPIALRYARADGQRAAEAAFVGDTSLVESLWNLAGCEGLGVVATLLEPVAAAGRDRKMLAEMLQSRIAACLGVACTPLALPHVRGRAEPVSALTVPTAT